MRIDRQLVLISLLLTTGCGRETSDAMGSSTPIQEEHTATVVVSGVGEYSGRGLLGMDFNNGMARIGVGAIAFDSSLGNLSVGVNMTEGAWYALMADEVVEAHSLDASGDPSIPSVAYEAGPEIGQVVRPILRVQGSVDAGVLSMRIELGPAFEHPELSSAKEMTVVAIPDVRCDVCRVPAGGGNCIVLLDPGLVTDECATLAAVFRVREWFPE